MNPTAGEDAELTTRRQVLANADRLQRLCGEAYTTLYDGDDAALSSLGVVWKKVTELAALDPRFDPYLDGREAVKSSLEDLAFFLRSYSADIDASPASLQEAEDRLAQLERLKKKHGPTLDEVLAARDALRSELSGLEHSTERAAALDVALAAARADYLRVAQGLSARRRAAARTFADVLVGALGELAMPSTRCEVRFADEGSQESRWSDRGIDEAEFYISPNPGEELRPLARIASGGELSRIMLALKTLATTDAPGKTLIFDEVDAGIGGAVADAVGARLQKLGRHVQVLCITHLPQIAAYAGAQFRIEKRVSRGRTTTEVLEVTGADRVGEIARMIGGADVSASVTASAREMLESRRAAAAQRAAKGKEKPKGESEGSAAQPVSDCLRATLNSLRKRAEFRPRFSGG